MNKSKINYKFLKSALDTTDIGKVISWINQQNNAVNVSVQKVPFSKLRKWHLDAKLGNLRHESGQFFSIDGIRINTTMGNIKSWDQPIINQPEVGYLGFITKEINGVLQFLVQAKIEPGNVNCVQLSPTLQATRSNYKQIHGGKKPPYLDYFQNADKSQILLDQLQSEQGGRFLKKRNRNIIIQVNEEVPLLENYIWLTLGQLKSLMQTENLVNMDTRTVISGIPMGSFDPQIIDIYGFLGNLSFNGNRMLKSALDSSDSFNSIEQIITFITEIKSGNSLDIVKIPLIDMNGWQITDTEIKRIDNRFFKIIGVDVEISNREVASWSQPMVEPAQEGLCAFVCKEINEKLHFAVQTKFECGNYDIVEFAPTVQTLTGDYRLQKASIPFLEYLLSAPREKIYLDTNQSEEGGRFYKEQNRNMIVIAGDEIPIELPENFIWMTLSQLAIFIKYNNYLNIQARNLIASITFK
ncbi:MULTISPECIES: NDP-hexose 2,3-dehydratase family protein [Comamonadaceae]|uniref:NDP-hexose 2,3-dehydratase family protein n=1 Tax=Comamonadaceae TaxID=80864 RepID=UPI002725DD72|nr:MULTISPECIES: NDP-hexose 2,3-dehydratase family protein [Comamonadaceae]MDO9145896.1 NDP-hexose 2,3-dehydratase family protein [Rhodoferax sp.]MDP3887637.1 NDP-hexose 2,3-dehydratase family protein [Hydrogenophaga sp.]